MSNNIEETLYRLSISQLKALKILTHSKEVLVSTSASKDIGKEGKALGGIFSAMSRRDFNGQKLILPWGKVENGRVIRWKLNEKLISKDRLLKITKELVG